MENLKMILPNCSQQFVHLIDITFSVLLPPSCSSLLAGGDGLICFISAMLQLTALLCDGPFKGKSSVAVALDVRWLVFGATVTCLWEGHGLSGEHLKQWGYEQKQLALPCSRVSPWHKRAGGAV